ncbi:hypothetical protein EX30DRAFT_351061 [Ascodesmis nigricans]|uniref:Uncharacterized protein n=1 Tax=Ascodesmis nigricans TaxID=341454 RepID=A0A4V3SI29_9PEZI|nr:hypothetical protein EX30DRAFT_351061 [Ascodesmis nigricans]
MCRLDLPLLVHALALPVCPRASDELSISCYNTNFASERIPIADVAHVANYFCHEVHGRPLLPGEELDFSVKSLSERPIQLRYTNTSPNEPWEVTYEACMEDIGRVWETCKGQYNTTAGGSAAWDDGVLSMEIKLPPLAGG